jgi:hypothetical protein
MPPHNANCGKVRNQQSKHQRQGALRLPDVPFITNYLIKVILLLMTPQISGLTNLMALYLD